jgi:hypothetical protein
MLQKFLFAVMLSSFYLLASGQSAITSNCYKEWYKLFTDRGATPVPDGDNEVIVAVVKDDVSNCYIGMLTVKDHKIVLGSLKVQAEDGSLQKFDRVLKKNVYYSPEQMTSTENGMTHSFLTSEDEVVRAFFYKSLNPPAKRLKKAPDPSQLVSN